MAQDDEDVAVQERPAPSVLASLVPSTSSFATDFPPSADAPATTTSVTTDSGGPTGSAFDSLLPKPEQMKAAGSALQAEYKRKDEAQSYVDRETFGRMERDRAQMDRAFQAEGAAAAAIPPKWDADKERAERIRGPMEQFGSVGSVFAMAASLFTKTPMTSALNAGAAAMKAIQASDEKGYESAYKAWKDNTDLALKRFNMEHQMFQDASHLLTSDMSAWAIKQKAIAARFENNTAMIMLENGMYKELIDVQASQVRAAKELTEAKKGFEEYNTQRELFKHGVESWEKENPDATETQKVQHRLKLLSDIKSAQRGTAQRGSSGDLQQYLSTRVPELMEAHQDDPNYTPGMAIRDATKEHTEATSKRGVSGTAGNPNLTGDRQRAQDVAAYREELKNAKNGDGSPKYTSQQIADMAAKREADLKAKATPITATNRDQLDSMITRIDTANGAIDKVEALLKKHNALTGLGGKITRPAEVVSNWFGSNETDRAQFRRYIEELRELGPRLLQESKSRPLSSEEKRIQAIVPGLDAGDTTVNTARGLKELQDLFKTLRAGLELRRKGEFDPTKPFGGAVPSKPEPKGGNPWDSAPIKVPAEKRSSVDGEQKFAMNDNRPSQSPLEDVKKLGYGSGTFSDKKGEGFLIDLLNQMQGGPKLIPKPRSSADDDTNYG